MLPVEGQAGRFHEFRGGKVKGMTVVEDRFGDVRAEESQPHETSKIRTGDAFPFGDFVQSRPITVDQFVTQRARSHDQLDQAGARPPFAG